MTMNMGQAVMTLQAIDAILYEKGVERKFSFKLRYKLYRIKEALQDETKKYESERITLIREYGDKVKKEGHEEEILEVVDEEKLKAFYEKLEEVLSTEIEPQYTLLSEKELDAIDDFEIEINQPQMSALFEFVFEPIKGMQDAKTK